MWLALPLIGLAALVAFVAALISPVLFAGIVVVLVVLYALGFLLGRRGPTIDTPSGPDDVPTSHEAAYHPASNPRRTGPDN